jgi:hypothetical protein
MKRSAQNLLTQWGVWTWQNTGVPRYVSPLLAMMRDAIPGVHGKSAAISDEDAEEISAILARLNQRYPKSYEAIELYYRFGRTQEQVARLMGEKRLKAREWIMAGECYVQAVLDMRESRCNVDEKMRHCA